MTTANTLGTSTTRTSRNPWRAPLGLFVLTIVPVAAGAVRLHQLGSGAAVTPENARFFGQPLPVVVHIIGASLFCVLGTLQFVPALRRRGARWHRIAGRVLVPAGLAAALSGLWMAVFYALPVHDGPLLEAFRLVFGTGMAVSLVLGVVAVRRRDFAAHRAWMMRGYAIGMGAGTQVVTVLPWVLLVGEPGRFTRSMLMLAGWVINLAVAEWLIRHAGARSAGTRSAGTRRVASRRFAGSPSVTG